MDFTVLGRGKAGRALAEAWGSRVSLVSREASPEGWILLAVPDAAIPEQAARFPGRCVHMSGSLHLEGVPCAHPLTSFDGEAQDWRGTPLGVSGPIPEIMSQAFAELGFLPFELPPELKALYHACAVLTSGHAATLWLGADRLLRESGIQLPGEGLLPLARATLRNIQQKGAAGRTGPFVRQDTGTIERDALALPEPWREIFLMLGHAPLGPSRE
ncbi:MAG: oxidoreductase coenzyme F420-dependent [Holophagaceae bacterium]|nr:oxidoreductase coenzyme F420-dependent [Holophagaceae bacterium]